MERVHQLNKLIAVIYIDRIEDARDRLALQGVILIGFLFSRGRF